MRAPFRKVAVYRFLFMAVCLPASLAPNIWAPSIWAPNQLAAAEPESTTPTFAASDWPWWRGPQRDGVAAPQDPPTTWSPSENIVWRSKVPGRGHGSLTLLADRVYLAAADREQQFQSVLCLDRATGQEQWQTKVHSGGLQTAKMAKANSKASFASSTVATDGQRLFINFVNDDAMWTTALDLAGDVLWQRKICDYVIHQGYGSSPTVYRNLVIVSADNKGGGAIAGLDRNTGEIVWRRDRPDKPNYTSPIILQAAGREQLVFTGCDLVTSLDPQTGKELWETEGATTECVTSVVTDGKRLFTSGGYPKNHIAAVTADGSGDVVWETNTRAYVPSLLHKDGYLFAVLDEGIATCIRAADGKTMWKSRLGGTFSASPVLVGERIYATNEEGQTFVFQASTERFEKLAENPLGESVFATPVIAGDQIFMRVAEQEDGRRQEYVVCIGEPNS